MLLCSRVTFIHKVCAAYFNLLREIICICSNTALLCLCQKQSATDLRRKIGFSSLEDIDQKVAALEHKMMTSTISLKEEKQLLEEIKRLKNSKPLLTKYQALEQSASSLEDSSVGTWCIPS